MASVSRRSQFRVQVAAVALLLAASLAVFGAEGSAGGTTSTLYVSHTGADSGTCSSSAAACATVSYALTQAGSPGDTILVSGTIDDNVVVDNQSVFIAQDPAGSPAVLDGTDKGSVITTEGTANLTLNQLTLTGGSAPSGGGVDIQGGFVTIRDSIISGNAATDSGGGIYNGSAFDLIDSTVSGNTALGSGFVGGAGGGIATSSGASGDISDSAITGNTAGGVGSGAEGGGVLNEGGTTNIDNSTISGNSATGPNGGGGGVSDLGNGVGINDSTISGNSATGYGAAIENVTGSLYLAGDILANAGGPPAVDECHQSLPMDMGYNVDDDGTCGLSAANHSVSHSTTIGDYLGPLQNNGGPTDTIALSSGASNPAQAVIPLTFTPPLDEFPACRTMDQRGVSRGSPCDMGAYALTVGVAPMFTSGTSTTFTEGAYGTFSFAATGSPPPTFSETGTLPAGTSLSPDGVLSGTPSSGGAGAYSISVTATNGVAPDAHQSFTFDVASAPPPPPTPTHGYWLVGSDGGIFSFGSAGFYGSMGGITCSARSWASCRRQIAVGTGSTRPMGEYSASGTPSSTDRSQGSVSIPPARGCPNRSTPRLSAWCPAATKRATSWSPLTAASSRSVMQSSLAAARASAGARVQQWQSCPMPAAMAIGSSPPRQSLHLRRRSLLWCSWTAGLTDHFGCGHARRQGLLDPRWWGTGLRLWRRGQPGQCDGGRNRRIQPRYGHLRNVRRWWLLGD